MATHNDAPPPHGDQLSPQEPTQARPDLSFHGQAEFLATISHEIRTPLNAIMGYAEMLSKTNLDAKQQHYAGNIVKSSLALVNILNTWLQHAKTPAQDLTGQDRPIDQPPVAPVPETPVPVRDNAPFKLLVVEDSSMIRDLFMDIFSEDHFAILTASSGARALELAFSELPQLIFLDLHLPDTDGWQVAASLRANAATAAIPLVVMTGQFLKTEEYSPYFDEFLQKPFHLKQLRSMVDSWVHRLSRSRPSETKVLPEPVDRGRETTLEDLAQCIQPYWDMQMSKLLAAISHTGNLYLAIELGKHLQAVGQEHNCTPMQQAGSRLVFCASEPDIVGVEAIINQLAPFLQVVQP